MVLRRPRPASQHLTSPPCLSFFSSFTVSVGLHLFTDHLHEHAFLAAAVELAVKNLLPWANIQFSIRDRHHNLASQEPALFMRVRNETAETPCETGVWSRVGVAYSHDMGVAKGVCLLRGDRTRGLAPFVGAREAGNRAERATEGRQP